MGGVCLTFSAHTYAEPVSIDPIDPTRPCPFNAADQCGASDYYDNATVLPGMDDLYPHDRRASGLCYACGRF